jgi:hypothetical protein
LRGTLPPAVGTEMVKYINALSAARASLREKPSAEERRRVLGDLAREFASWAAASGRSRAEALIALRQGAAPELQLTAPETRLFIEALRETESSGVVAS